MQPFEPNDTALLYWKQTDEEIYPKQFQEKNEPPTPTEQGKPVHLGAVHLEVTTSCS